MSALSDTLLIVAILGYLLTMVLHAAEYTFGAKRASAPEEVRELVAVGAEATGTVPVAAVDERTPIAAMRIGMAATVATWLAVVAHVGSAAARGIAADRMPWGNMYEFTLTVTAAGGIAWLAISWSRPQVRRLGLVVALVEVLLLGIAGMVLYTEINPLMPALRSTWFVVHVTAVVLAASLFMIGFVPAAMFLVRTGHDHGKTRFPYSLGPRMPSAANLERLAFQLHAFAFPIWTFGVAAGAIWAEAAWGRYWGWDPKEVWSFVSWVVYAGYLHARATPSVKRTTVAWIAVLGFATMLMNLFGVNIFMTGLHSYAGIE